MIDQLPVAVVEVEKQIADRAHLHQGRASSSLMRLKRKAVEDGAIVPTLSRARSSRSARLKISRSPQRSISASRVSVNQRLAGAWNR